MRNYQKNALLATVSRSRAKVQYEPPLYMQRCKNELLGKGSI